MNILKLLFKKKPKFVLPKPGDLVGYSDETIKTIGFGEKFCFRVVRSFGDEKYNKISLHCATVLYTGQWKILPKDTPINC